MSKNYKPQKWSPLANKSKEEAFLAEEDRKEKLRLELLELQKVDAEKLKAMIDAINSLDALFNSVDMESGKGKVAKAWIKERLTKACANSEIMYHKLKGEI